MADKVGHVAKGNTQLLHTGILWRGGGKGGRVTRWDMGMEEGGRGRRRNRKTIQKDQSVTIKTS